MLSDDARLSKITHDGHNYSDRKTFSSNNCASIVTFKVVEEVHVFIYGKLRQ